MRLSVLAVSPEDLCEPLSMVQAVLRDSPSAVARASRPINPSASSAAVISRSFAACRSFDFDTNQDPPPWKSPSTAIYHVIDHTTATIMTHLWHNASSVCSR
jgi:hypothetical protein